MIAMQYGFALPADYDMSIIERRIRTKGPALDGFPHLRFKAYLSAQQRHAAFTSKENLYAPFYLWDSPEGLNAFLTSPAFAAVARDLGWPRVQTWMVWHADLRACPEQARYATRSLIPITPYSDLGALRHQARSDAANAIRRGAMAAVTGFDPHSWTLMHFQLWKTAPTTSETGSQSYAVGYLALPSTATCL